MHGTVDEVFLRDKPIAIEKFLPIGSKGLVGLYMVNIGEYTTVDGSEIPNNHLGCNKIPS